MEKIKPAYPHSRIESVEEYWHGVIIRDDYRWLEGDEKGNTTPEVSEWTDQQNSFTRSVLDKLPGRDALKERIRPLLQKSECSLPTFAGDKLFYFRREGDRNQPVNYIRDGVDGEERVLIDPNQLDPSGLTSVAWIAPSQNGELIAWGVYKSGDENYQLRIMRTADCSALEDVIDNKVIGVYWLPDNESFIYSKLADPANPYSRQICYHKLGDNPENDRLIFEQYKEGPLATTWGPFAHLSEDGQWLILGYHTSTRSNDLWIADFNVWLARNELRLHEIIKDSDSTNHARVFKSQLYIYTNEGAPNGRIFVADPVRPERENWHELIKEARDAVIEDWDFTSDSIILGCQKNACSELVRFRIEPRSFEIITLPGLGTAGFSCDETRPDFFYRFESYNRVPEIIHHSFETEKAETWWKTDINVDLSNMNVTQHWFASNDGTQVSMFLIHRDGIEKNGQNPTIIYGYGGFAIGMTPAFSGLIVPWIEDGGIYAVVNLRGGNEYGDNWHKMGTRANKKRVFEDFEAAALYMIDQHYTCSDQLAISGRSNGGLLTGAALTRKPGLYRAVICGVPLLDMLRYQNFLMARYWVPEYGSAENAEEFDWLIEYSPYQNVCNNREYPAVFLFTGENDTRVHPMHARKMAAVLQKNAKNLEDKPIILWVDRHSGHGMGKPLNLVLEEQTDQWIFLRWQTGLKADK